MDHPDTTRRQPPPRAAASPARTGAEWMSGPRQEYLNAFAEEEFGTYPPPGGQQPARATRRAGAARAGGQPGDGPEPGAGPEPASGSRADRPGPGPGSGQRDGRARGWGRALSGVAAAAVVTVLVVITAGEVADADRDLDPSDLAAPTDLGGHGDSGAGARQEGDPGGAGGDQSRPGPEAPPTGQPGEVPAEPGFEELMGTSFEMDPELTGAGRLVPVGGGAAADDPDAATVLRYRVDVEAGVGLDEEFFAEAVDRTLRDPRGWSREGELSFARVSGDDYDFIITLASPGTTADWCARSGLDTTEDNVSCNSSSTDRVMINGWRWAQGSETFGDDIRGYRQMLINHEVGHRLGWGHEYCTADGALAPVMMQQTKFLTTDGHTCEPNPWPNPQR